MPATPNLINLGRFYVMSLVSGIIDVFYCTGFLKGLKIKNVSETITYYSFY